MKLSIFSLWWFSIQNLVWAVAKHKRPVGPSMWMCGTVAHHVNKQKLYTRKRRKKRNFIWIYDMISNANSCNVIWKEKSCLPIHFFFIYLEEFKTLIWVIILFTIIWLVTLNHIINDLIIYVVGFLTHATHSFNIIYNKNRVRYLIHVLDDWLNFSQV